VERSPDLPFLQNPDTPFPLLDNHLTTVGHSGTPLKENIMKKIIFISRNPIIKANFAGIVEGQCFSVQRL
jgi:hypothetical protein